MGLGNGAPTKVVHEVVVITVSGVDGVLVAVVSLVSELLLIPVVVVVVSVIEFARLVLIGCRLSTDWMWMGPCR